MSAGMSPTHQTEDTTMDAIETILNPDFLMANPEAAKLFFDRLITEIGDSNLDLRAMAEFHRAWFTNAQFRADLGDFLYAQA